MSKCGLFYVDGVGFCIIFGEWGCMGLYFVGEEMGEALFLVGRGEWRSAHFSVMPCLIQDRH